MVENNGDQGMTKLEQALQQEQQQERSEQREGARRQGDIDSRIADALTRGGTSTSD